jgi:prepilin-type N-terminal cleavage/methylation domain-containing protein
MNRNQKGFTLVELMIVCMIIVILAAIALPNFMAMQIRKHEGGTKVTMHTVQLCCEDIGVQHDGVYDTNPAKIMAIMPSNPRNAFTGKQLKIWEFDHQPTTKLPPGDIVVYTPDGCPKGSTYVVRGVMHDSTLSALTLTAGQ